MLSLARILVAIDFSERSLRAIRWAEFLARHFRPELTLLHALGSPCAGPSVPDPSCPDAGPKLNRLCRAEELLDSVIDKELRGVRAKGVVVPGEPAGGIVEHAGFDGGDLIVMTTRGRGACDMGAGVSVTAKVLRDARCPVWAGTCATQAPALRSSTIKRILCAVALGPQSEKVLRWASLMAARLRAALVLLHAEPQLELVPGRYFDLQWRIDLDRMIRNRAGGLRSEVGTKAEVCLAAGKAAQAVGCAAAHLRADLLVIGRSPAARVFGPVLASTYRIICAAPCPVVSV